MQQKGQSFMLITWRGIWEQVGGFGSGIEEFKTKETSTEKTDEGDNK